MKQLGMNWLDLTKMEAKTNGSRKTSHSPQPFITVQRIINTIKFMCLLGTLHIITFGGKLHGKKNCPSHSSSSELKLHPGDDNYLPWHTYILED